MWLRRGALIAQLLAKGDTDEERLFSYCRQVAGESEFFIRKAVGWALRDYARHDPEAVKRFLRWHEGELSPLSLKEAAKHLGEWR